MKKLILFLSFALMALGFTACKKDDATPVVVAKADVRDSVYYLATELYLWRDKLPTLVDFKATGYATAEDAMTKVRTYSPLGTSGKNVDRWSFAMKKTDWDKVASGNNGDFGCGFRFSGADNALYISYTYAKSSAGVMGLQRGYKVLKINGVAATSDNVAGLNTELGKSAITLDIEKPDASKSSVTITRVSYATNPVLSQNIIKQGSKNIGYLAFNSFLGATAEKEINDAFTFFKNNGVSELVVDLRYNGGGYVSLAELMANLIVPTSAAGKLMYQDTHNAKYVSWNKTKNFDATPKANALGLSRVVFITTGGSASASELLINVLQPYMDVKLVGATTYGKPAGYYGLPTMDYYSFPLAVKQVNANGYGDFYDGLPVSKSQRDDVAKNWGDPAEACLSDALIYIKNGVFSTSVSPSQNARLAAIDALNQDLDEGFKGLIMRNPQIKR